MASIFKAVIKTGLATGAFALVHSAFASRAAKRTASRVVGPTNADGWYRVTYIGQSAATAGLLVRYLESLPSIELYHVRGPVAAAMHAAQLAGLAYATAGARQVGILRISGIENLAAWLRKIEVPSMPEAQGPGFSGASNARAAGPFAASRHPLNLSPLPVLWLWPKMNSTLLAFNVAATVYLVIGSLHEEQRLLDIEGEEYAAYQRSGVSFYWPRLNCDSSQTVRELSNTLSYEDVT